MSMPAMARRLARTHTRTRRSASSSIAFTRRATPGDDTMPVANITLSDATEFCRRLTSRDRASGPLPAGYRYELPPEARQHVYDEIARVVKRGGSVLITEYANTPHHHPLYWFWPTRWIIGYLEPFLPSFWQEDVVGKLSVALQRQGKTLSGEPEVEHCFANFYRVMRFRIG